MNRYKRIMTGWASFLFAVNAAVLLASIGLAPRIMPQSFPNNNLLEFYCNTHDLTYVPWLFAVSAVLSLGVYRLVSGISSTRANLGDLAHADDFTTE